MVRRMPPAAATAFLTLTKHTIILLLVLISISSSCLTVSLQTSCTTTPAFHCRGWTTTTGRPPLGSRFVAQYYRYNIGSGGGFRGGDHAKACRSRNVLSSSVSPQFSLTSPVQSVVPPVVVDTEENESYQGVQQEILGTQRQQQLVLLSLQWTDANTLESDSRNERPFSKTVADVWRWKDSVLGDGRDFFVPKPKTLQALQAYLKEEQTQHQHQQFRAECVEISECVVVSNCARFEIMLVVSVPTTSPNSHNNTTMTTTTLDSLIQFISQKVLSQVQFHQRRQKQPQYRLLTTLTQWDWPGIIIDVKTMNEAIDSASTTAAGVDELCRSWTVLVGPRDVSRHVCLVAAGLAQRPKRPTRTVTFRPFSSRDAHILCQLKRTYDIAIQPVSSSSSSSSTSSIPQSSTPAANRPCGNPVLSMVVRLALQAGKGARNHKLILGLSELRRHYGETGNSKKFDVEPPMATMKLIEREVHELAIDPSVDECVKRWNERGVIYTGRGGERIAAFRERAIALAESSTTAAATSHGTELDTERRYILKRIHLTTVQLRAGDNVDETLLLKTISEELEVMRLNEKETKRHGDSH